MPSVQRGTVTRRGKRWLVRWYDEAGARRARGGFETRSAALDWLNGTLSEVNALRRGERVAVADIPTVAELVERFLATHEVDPATTDKLRYELKHAIRAFGDERVDQLRTPELAAWRATLPARSRHQLFRSFRQVLEQAVTWQMIERNPSDRIRNRRVKLDEDREIRPFASWDEVEAIAAELEPRVPGPPDLPRRHGHEARGGPRAGVEGHRPEGRRWRRSSGCTPRAERSRARSRTASAGGCRSGRRCSRRWRTTRAGSTRRLCSPATTAATSSTRRSGCATGHPRFRRPGIEHRSVYTCRHTFAAWSIAAGVQLFYLSGSWARRVAQIDTTYGHLVPDSEEYLRGLLDKYDDNAVIAARNEDESEREKPPAAFGDWA